MNNVFDPYLILGVSQTASAAELKDAHIRLILLHHPDKNPGDPTAAARAARINSAYDCVSTPERRARIDAILRDARAAERSTLRVWIDEVEALRKKHPHAGDDVLWMEWARAKVMGDVSDQTTVATTGIALGIVKGTAKVFLNAALHRRSDQIDRVQHRDARGRFAKQPRHEASPGV